MARAEFEANRIFRQTGIQVIWLDCLPETPDQVSSAICSESRFPKHLHLRILKVSRGVDVTTVGISFSSSDGVGCKSGLFMSQ